MLNGVRAALPVKMADPRISHKAYNVNLQARGSASFQTSEILNGARASFEYG